MLQFHPLANLFPLLEGAEFEALVDDIRRHGVREPIVLYDGAVLDGRNRYRAAKEAGVDCPGIEFTGGDPLSFVLSRNLHRRHLDESQRAMVAAKVATLPRGANQHASIEAPSQDEAAALLNVSRSAVQRAIIVRDQGVPELQDAVVAGTVAVSTAAEIARDTPEQQRFILASDESAVIARAREIQVERNKVRWQERVQTIERISRGNAPLPTDRRYPLIYADPAYRYEHQSECRRVEDHFPTMTVEEICALPVADIAADKALLYLWSPMPKLTEALKIVTAWGFEYRTGLVWVKDKIGTGYHARAQHELLLIARRGDMPAPLMGTQSPSVIFAERPDEHSEKPEVFYELIEGLYPDVGKIELFARKRRDGWAAWGNQAPPAAAAE